MDVFYSFICIILSFSLFFLYFRKWKELKRYLLKFNEETTLFDLLIFICLVKIGLYYCVPSITHLITDWKPVYAERIAPSEVTLIYVIEFLSYLIYIFTIQIYIQKRKPNITMTHIKASKVFVIALLGLALFEYYDSISILGQSESSLDSLWFIIPFVRNCGIFLVLYIITKGTPTFSRLTVLCALGTLVVFLAFAITAGVRSLLVWPIVFFMYFSYKYNKKRMKLYLPIGIVAALLMAVFQDSLVAMRGQDAKAADKISNMDTSRDLGSVFMDFFEEVDYRFGAMTTYGVGYVRLVQQGKSAGLNPILNSLYAPIPRRYFENKPVAGSYDGTKEGEGMYISTATASATVTYSMTEPASGAHAYWELGIFGIILFSIIPALYVMYSISSFRSFGILAIPLFMVVFKLEYMEPKLWVSAIILQFVQVNIPVYFIKRLYISMGRKLS